MIRYQISLSSFYTYIVFPEIRHFIMTKSLFENQQKKINFKIHTKCFFLNKHENKVIWEFDK